MLPPIAPSVGTPYFGIITIPTPIQSDWDGDDRVCGGGHVRQTWDRCHLNPLGGHLGKAEAPVEECHTGSLLRFLRFLRSCAWCGCRCTRFSDCGVMTYRIPRHIGCSPNRSKDLGKEPVYVRLSGAEEGSLLSLLLCRWLSLACSSHPPISNNPQAEVAQ
jgi:hypothetical protein